jgi:SAM-dependent methyltransferase
MGRTTREVTNAVTGAAAHLGIDLGEYDARIRTFIPGYEEMLDSAAAALQSSVTRKRPVVVDLGIGTGALAQACLRRVPGARVIGVDEDAGMLDAARDRLGRSLVRTIAGSFETIALPPCDAVVASLALHHIPTAARRQRLFRRIHRALRAGGVLVTADCHPSSNRRLAGEDRASWLRHLETSYTPAEARGYLRSWAREDHYAPLADEVVALRRAGFVADVRTRRDAFAVIVATAS